MWGIVPAAGRGTRLQPLTFSKELIPLGSRVDNGVERPRAVSEYLLERMIMGGADKICIVISPDKSDILRYFGDCYGSAHIVYAVQPRPCGLCDAVFRAHPLMTDDEPVIVGLPDTIWFPDQALATLPDDVLSFLLFPVERPEFFDAVVLDSVGRVLEIQVKQPNASSHWIWGAFKMPGRAFAALQRLRAPPIIVIFIWGSSARTAHRKRGSTHSRRSRLRSEFASGFIFRTIGSTARCAG